MQPNRNCPSCKAEWDGKHFVGEKAITTSEKYLQGKRRSGGSRRARQEAEQEAEQEADGNEGDCGYDPVGMTAQVSRQEQQGTNQCHADQGSGHWIHAKQE